MKRLLPELYSNAQRLEVLAAEINGMLSMIRGDVNTKEIGEMFDVLNHEVRVLTDRIDLLEKLVATLQVGVIK